MAAIATERPQHLVALAQADRVRFYRYELRRRVAAGDVNAAERVAVSRQRAAGILLEADPLVATMRVADVLNACHRSGHSTTRKILRRAGVSELKTIGGLTMRQAAELAQLVQRDGDVRPLWEQQP